MPPPPQAMNTPWKHYSKGRTSGLEYRTEKARQHYGGQKKITISHALPGFALPGGSKRY